MRHQLLRSRRSRELPNQWVRRHRVWGIAISKHRRRIQRAFGQSFHKVSPECYVYRFQITHISPDQLIVTNVVKMSSGITGSVDQGKIYVRTMTELNLIWDTIEVSSTVQRVSARNMKSVVDSGTGECEKNKREYKLVSKSVTIIVVRNTRHTKALYNPTRIQPSLPMTCTAKEDQKNLAAQRTVWIWTRTDVWPGYW